MNLRYYKNETTMVAKLADQAHAETSVRYAARIKTEHPAGVIFYDMFNQRFAELIIQECAKLCDERAASATMGSDEQCEAEDCSHAIKKHFGVE